MLHEERNFISVLLLFSYILIYWFTDVTEEILSNWSHFCILLVVTSVPTGSQVYEGKEGFNKRPTRSGSVVQQ